MAYIIYVNLRENRIIGIENRIASIIDAMVLFSNIYGKLLIFKSIINIGPWKKNTRNFSQININPNTETSKDRKV